MLENLNAISFQKYGKVVYEGFDAACRLISETPPNIFDFEAGASGIDRLLYCTESPVVVDVIDGIALLCVSSKSDFSDFKVFLLDKTVVIHAGIYYNFFAFYGTCRIKTANAPGASSHALPYPFDVPRLGFFPAVQINKIYTLFYQEKEKGFTFKGEKHNFWELTYVDRGRMHNDVDGQHFVLQQGDALFYGKGQHHAQWAEPGLSVCFITITFDMDFQEAEFLTNKRFVVDTELKHILEKIIKERNQNFYYADDLIICYLKEFIIKLIRSEKLENTIHQLDTPVKTRVENSIVKKCMDYIEKNIHRKITVPDIARSIPVSPSYLSAIFKKQMGVTLMDYVNHYKLERSKELIRTSDLNFTQISELLGYTSVHYFSNQFRLMYGITPTEYAKSISKSP